MVAHAAALDNMPPVARFLSEVTRARTAVVSAFDWGVAARLPFLPRVRCGRAVLAPARWRLPAGELPGPKAPRREWVAAMAAVRRRLRLPTTVYAGAGGPRLRLRIHLTGGRDYGQAACRVGAWATGLRRRGLIGDLILDTYHPETGRYGAGAAQVAAETVFAADSAAVLSELAALRSGAVHPHALTAASMADIVAAVSGGVPAGMRWLIGHANIGPAASCAALAWTARHEMAAGDQR